MLQQARPHLANRSAQPGHGRSFPRFSVSTTSTQIIGNIRSRQRRTSSPRSREAYTLRSHAFGHQAQRMGSEGAQESRVQAWLGAGQLPHGLVGMGFLAGSWWLACLQRCKSLIACTINRYTYRDERPTTAPRLKAEAHPDRLTPGGAGEPSHPVLLPQGRSRTR